ncbi:unnamed protein product [Acanthosepion pharaonis]|uniref:Parvovirus non-structural protein 1 helicase domain-containing protein n=1 Tax=Acanthosepion pharaonis TaxID=158019 RepID=A0A812BNW2_ACAPH|nr:unnamed protein product [Sepia pharaonis]
MIYTDEMWFTPQNVEEAKCILEGTETYVNVKHQNERLLRRTPFISTSNSEPWKVVLHEKEAILNRMYHYTTTRSMPRLEKWGKVELNPLMWLTVWKRHIDKYANNEYHEILTELEMDDDEPKQAKTLLYFIQWDGASPKKRRRLYRVKKTLAAQLQQEDERPGLPGCRFDDEQAAQVCAAHMRSMADCSAEYWKYYATPKNQTRKRRWKDNTESDDELLATEIDDTQTQEH